MYSIFLKIFKIFIYYSRFSKYIQKLRSWIWKKTQYTCNTICMYIVYTLWWESLAPPHTVSAGDDEKAWTHLGHSE